MSHLTEDQTVVGDNALDGVEGAVGVVGRIHAHVAVLIAILERHLTVLEELFCKLIRYHELALAMADGNIVYIAFLEGGEPRGTGGGHAGAHQSRDVTVDIVTIQCRGVGSHIAQLAKWQQTGLDERLEAVADTEHQALTVQQVFHRRFDLRMVEHVGDELAAAVGLVTQAETAGQCENLRLTDSRRQFVDGMFDGRLVQVLED